MHSHNPIAPFFFPFLPQPHFCGKSSSLTRMRTPSFSHLCFRAALNMATPGLANPSQNPFHLLDPWIPESRVLLGSPVPLVPSRSFPGHMSHMCTGTHLPQKPPHAGTALHQEPWHTSAAPHARVSCASPRIPSRQPGTPRIGESLADVAGISSHAGGHAQPWAASCSIPRDVPGTPIPPRLGLPHARCSSCCPQGRMSPEDEWERSPPGTKMLIGLKAMSPIAREGQGCSGGYS